MKNFNDLNNSGIVLSEEQMNSVKGGALCQFRQGDRPYFVTKEVALSTMEAGHATRWYYDSCVSASWAAKEIVVTP